jgi:NADPH:quinone reductase-like Zn-dependent oxidoreductase
MKARRVIGLTAGILLLGLVTTWLIAYARSGNACDDRTAAPTYPTKAIVHCDYGPPSVLKLEDVEKPVPTDSQLLVRVRAASVNPVDWHEMRGTPYFGRLGMGLRKPSSTRIGVDFSGVVEAVGKSVTQFKPGDEVFGGRTGSLAEYVTVRENGNVVRKPPNVTFEQAASIGVAALTALQGLRDHGKIQAGQKVLINGASGGVGPFAVQIAKAFGANVTGVCSTRNVEMVKSIGADQVVDYTKESFITRPERYDLILDNVGNHSLSDLHGLLKPNGRYVMVSGPMGNWVDPLPRILDTYLRSKVAKQNMSFFIATLNKKDLQLMADLMASGKVRPVIDRTYKLSEAAAAIAYLEEGHARGKVIVKMD